MKMPWPAASPPSLVRSQPLLAGDAAAGHVVSVSGEVAPSSSSPIFFFLRFIRVPMFLPQFSVNGLTHTRKGCAVHHTLRPGWSIGIAVTRSIFKVARTWVGCAP
jgi:hypothetical protein